MEIIAITLRYLTIMKGTLALGKKIRNNPWKMKSLLSDMQNFCASEPSFETWQEEEDDRAIHFSL